MPVEALSATGSIVNFNQEASPGYPSPLHPRPDRYIDLVLQVRLYDALGKTLIAGLLLWIIAVFTLTRLEYKPAYETSTLIQLFILAQLIGVPISAIAALFYAELLSALHRRTHAKGMKLGKIEKYTFPITRALIVEKQDNAWLLLRANWYGANLIYFFPPLELKRLGIDLDEPIGQDAEISINPLSRVCTKFTTHGEPVPTRRTSSVKLRYLASKIHGVKGASDEWVFLGRRKSKGSYFTSD